MTTQDLLREAAALIRSRGAEAVDCADERWMMDQDEAGGLVLAAFVPEDVEPDGTVSSSIIASFAYPDDPQRRTHQRALAAASHMAGLDPPAAAFLAAWLETTASFQDRAEELGEIEGAAPLVDPAVDFAHAYLRAATAG